MRRKDREITAFRELVDIMERCDVCRIALNDREYPYILPLNFGLRVLDGERVELYFHGAAEGTKYALMDRDPRASFEMDCDHRLVGDVSHGNCTMEYRSVIGQGHIERIPEEEKLQALEILMGHYHMETFPFDRTAVPRTTVFKLVVERMTGKALQKRGGDGDPHPKKAEN